MSEEIALYGTRSLDHPIAELARHGAARAAALIPAPRADALVAVGITLGLAVAAADHAYGAALVRDDFGAETVAHRLPWYRAWSAAHPLPAEELQP